jgi:hypothetical protein
MAVFLNSKTKKPARVGISHHVSFMRPYGLFDTPLVVFSNWMTRFAYCDDVAHKCDFMGINYYGQVGLLKLIVHSNLIKDLK